MWLASKSRLWTADRRRRHGLEAHDTCWLCDQERETSAHLLSECCFAKEVWWALLSTIDCAISFPQQQQLSGIQESGLVATSELRAAEEKKGKGSIPSLC
jgi:hypothetical protein